MTKNIFQESVTPTSGIQPIVEEIANEDEDSKKDDAISTSATATPPVQEIRYQSNPYVNAGAPVTPTLSVMGYAPPQPTFTAPLDNAGTIYHTGVRNEYFAKIKLFVVFENGDESDESTKLKLFFCFIHFPSSFKYLDKSEAGWHIICFVTTCDVLLCYVNGM